MRFNYIVYLLILTILPCFPAVAKSIEVKIEGVDGDLLKNVKAHLTILQYQDHAQANTRMVKRLHKDASTEIQSALQPFGYYQATVKKKLAQQEQHWVAHYTILLGPATTVTKLAIDISGSGKDLPAFQHWQQQFPLPVSATLVHSQYEDAKKRLLNIAAEQGFLQAKLLQHEVIVEPKSNSASITLSFDTGPRFQFGEVEFLQDILTPELLQKYLPFRHGDPFQTKQLIQLQRLLADSNYFAQVDVQPRTDQPQGLEIPIEVKLTPRKATSYTFGLGFGTDTGPRAKTGVDYRRLNRRGHQLSADLHLSPILSKASLDYRIPLRDPVKEHLSISPSWVR